MEGVQVNAGELIQIEESNKVSEAEASRWFNQMLGKRVMQGKQRSTLACFW